LPQRLVGQRKSTGFGHAEQFLVDRMPLQPILAALPPELGEFLDLAALRRHWQRGEAHSTLWFAVSVALWYRSIYG
ncbi:MAG: asparagine synthetase B, partial [Xanthomonas sp.]